MKIDSQLYPPIAVFLGLVLSFCACAVSDMRDTQPPALPRPDVPEFDAVQTIAEGRLLITPTDRRDYGRPPLKLKLPITKGMPGGTKLVRLFFSDVSQSWCAVVTHPSYQKVSPAGVVPVMTLILKVGE